MNAAQPMFNIPRSVLAVLALVVGVHLVRYLLSAEDDLLFVLALAFIPARYGGTAADFPGGALAAVTSFATYMLVHSDIVHLMVNSVWLLAFGSAIAQRVGGLRFILFSLMCGVAGALTHLVVHFGELIPVVGASAAISGQMAAAIRFLFAGGGTFAPGSAYARHMPLAPISQALREPRILVFLAVWAVLNVLLGTGILNFQGVEGGIAWEAHLGGFLAGLFGFGLFDRKWGRTPMPLPPDRPTLH